MMVRTPEKGRVKTRLAASLSESFVVDLYKHFISDLLAMLNQGHHQFTIYYDPPDTESEISAWLGNHFRYKPQSGDTLGERIRNALCEQFEEGYKNIIVIGSDSPDLPGSFLDEALLSLEENDAVVGPSRDGGYYLIGFHKEAFLTEAFDGIDWGTERVYVQTMTVFQKHVYNVHVLQEWYDIDRFEDLKDFFLQNINSDFAHSNTMRFLLDYRDNLIKNDFS
jgi:uncharacterized protein